MERNAAASLQLLSEASGAERDAQPDSLPVISTDRVLRPRLQIKNDVNFVPDDETISAYESFSSSESDDNVGVGNDDDDDDRGESDKDDDHLSEDNAVQMDEAFIESLHVGNDAINKQAAQKHEIALRGMEWTSVSSGFESDVFAYPGLTMEEARPVTV
ncbi:hypothetical protein PC129_g19735 [Phytophthora cactorum]|uniref:Uncharacterized protein n=1 Tax=Phytophthora cactorum TaxID=29920 RepID=A0A329S5V9_9STRA|nr:hypothetical protein Pcac1_g4392 [Phytophthora cactorum]KAG2810378.1 hypothetical protein PC112_g16074 [Phytophthora cactorum]KAG2813243.1 hypothetical protein PC111_g14478 [Phytophthora cactorum]KAG2851129.1 hypothetical protein PC113_g16166 [Phytophthora cactorum]KAG2894243.1 hypothetical protein PC114_g15969 [Phytophthora cactorum]